MDGTSCLDAVRVPPSPAFELQKFAVPRTPGTAKKKKDPRLRPAPCCGGPRRRWAREGRCTSPVHRDTSGRDVCRHPRMPVRRAAARGAARAGAPHARASGCVPSDMQSRLAAPRARRQPRARSGCARRSCCRISPARCLRCSSIREGRLWHRAAGVRAQAVPGCSEPARLLCVRAPCRSQRPVFGRRHALMRSAVSARPLLCASVPRRVLAPPGSRLSRPGLSLLGLSRLGLSSHALPASAGPFL